MKTAETVQQETTWMHPPGHMFWDSEPALREPHITAHIIQRTSVGFTPADTECEEYTAKCGITAASWWSPAYHVPEIKFADNEAAIPDDVIRCPACFGRSDILKSLRALRSDTMPPVIAIAHLVPHMESTVVMDELVCSALGPLTRGCDVLNFVGCFRHHRERQYIISRLVPPLHKLRPHTLERVILRSLWWKMGAQESMFYEEAANALQQVRPGLAP